jgi:hypothetical protein
VTTLELAHAVQERIPARRTLRRALWLQPSRADPSPHSHLQPTLNDAPSRAKHGNAIVVLNRFAGRWGGPSQWKRGDVVSLVCVFLGSHTAVPDC